MICVVKRDGEVTDFNLSKIQNAIAKAFVATGKQFGEDMMQLLALRVTESFNRRFKTARLPWKIFRTVWKRY